MESTLQTGQGWPVGVDCIAGYRKDHFRIVQFAMGYMGNEPKVAKGKARVEWGGTMV